jgi:hypothetical protein
MNFLDLCLHALFFAGVRNFCLGTIRRMVFGQLYCISMETERHALGIARDEQHIFEHRALIYRSLQIVDKLGESAPRLRGPRFLMSSLFPSYAIL